MDEWPKSWAGVDEDKEPGARLVVELRHFVAHLVERGLTPRTIRNHIDNLWAIGGEIIRDFHDEPSLRGRPARQLLLDAIGHGEAPLLYGASAEDQSSADATARKLLRFLSGTGGCQ